MHAPGHSPGSVLLLAGELALVGDVLFAGSIGRTDLLPAIVLRMVSIGEVSGHLDDSLERASSFYDREVPQLIAGVLTLFNTGVIVMLGAALATLVLSIFAPLYSMMGELSAGAS